MVNLKLNLTRLVVILLAVLSFTSCRDDQPDEYEPQPQSLTARMASGGVTSASVKQGIMYFPNIESFEAAIAKLQELDEDEILAKIDAYGSNFNSLYKKVAELESNEDLYEDELESLIATDFVDIPDAAFRALLNENGEYIVGNTVHKVTATHELSKTFSSDEELNNLDWYSSSVAKEEILFGEGDYSLEEEGSGLRTITRKKTPYNGDFFWQNGSTYTGPRTSDLSAHLMMWNRRYGLYASLGVKIRGRKKKRRRWKNDSMHFAKLEYVCSGQARTTLPLRVFDFNRAESKSGVNKKTVQKTIYWKIGYQVAIIVDELIVDYTYEDDGYPRVYRFDEDFVN